MIGICLNEVRPGRPEQSLGLGDAVVDGLGQSQ